MRKEDSRKLTFSVVDRIAGEREHQDKERTGILVDASAAGIGFVTDEPLETGSLIRYYLSGIRHSGIVMWRVNTDNKKFRVGVRVVGEHGREH